MSNLITSKSFIHFVYLFIRLYAWTFQLKVENEKAWMDHINSGGKVLICAWHQQFFTFIRHFQKYAHLKPGLMISRSKDGELIAGVANRSGWYTMRGSSSKGGQQAMGQIIERLSQSVLAGHVVDGPRGPAGIVKGGVIRIAQETGAVIVPTYAVALNAWFFNSWDRFLLPKPFSKVTIRYGNMIPVEKTDNLEDFEKQRKSLENTMLPGLLRCCLDYMALRVRSKITYHSSPPIHSAWLRCSSVKYACYSPSSRLAMRATRRRRMQICF